MTDNKSRNEKLTLNREIRFLTLAGQALPAKLLQISVFGEGAALRCSIKLELAWPVYTAIIEGRWFSLHPNALGGVQTASFEEERPIELNVELRKGIAEGALQSETACEDLAAALLQDQSENAGLNLSLSENWLAVEVKQQVELPESLASEGTLKQGYRTIWAENANVGSPASVASETGAASTDMHETVDKLLLAWGWTFQRQDNDLLSLKYQGEAAEWTVLILTAQEKQLCLVYSVYPGLVPEESRKNVSDWMTETNYELPIGSFEMDFDDGELRFRCGIDVENDRLSPELLSNLLSTNVAVMDLYYQELSQILAADH